MARDPDPFTDGYLEAVARVAAGDADRPRDGSAWVPAGLSVWQRASWLAGWAAAFEAQAGGD